MTKVHITSTRNEFYETIVEDAGDGGETNWSVNRHCRSGDTIAFYVCAPVSAIVAIGTISTRPERDDDPKSEWFNFYFSEIHGLRMLQTRLSRKALLTAFPEWKY